MEEPLDGLPFGLVAQLPGQLEDPGGAGGRHPDPPTSAVHLGVAVLAGALRRVQLGPGGDREGGVDGCGGGKVLE